VEPLSDDLQENLDRMIVESLENGCVWGLQDAEENWALVGSTDSDTIDVIPFWSNEEFAQALCNGDWDIYKPVPIEMGEFLDEWLPGMHSDVLMVGALRFAGRVRKRVGLRHVFRAVLRPAGIRCLHQR